MNKENRSALDRELFSELIESPIHPLLINMVRPYVDSCDPKFRLQINGEALWHWREVRGQPSVAFDVLQASISRIGYKLEESARDRVGHAIRPHYHEHSKFQHHRLQGLQAFGHTFWLGIPQKFQDSYNSLEVDDNVSPSFQERQLE